MKNVKGKSECGESFNLYAASIANIKRSFSLTLVAVFALEGALLISQK